MFLLNARRVDMHETRANLHLTPNSSRFAKRWARTALPLHGAIRERKNSRTLWTTDGQSLKKRLAWHISCCKIQWAKKMTIFTYVYQNMISTYVKSCQNKSLWVFFITYLPQCCQETCVSSLYPMVDPPPLRSNRKQHPPGSSRRFARPFLGWDIHSHCFGD